MDLAKIIAVRRKILVQREEEQESYKSMIQEVREDSFDIQLPTGAGRRPLLLRAGDIVTVKVIASHEQFHFQTRVKSRKRANLPLYILEKPEPDSIKRIQMRNYVRVKCVFDVRYRILKKGEEKKAVFPEPDREGIAIDLSGGGVQMMVTERIPEKSVLLLWFKLKKNNGKETEIQTLGRVVRSIETIVKGVKKNILGIEFLNIAERDRDKIVAFTFRELLQQRNRGLD